LFVDHWKDEFMALNLSTQNCLLKQPKNTFWRRTKSINIRACANIVSDKDAYAFSLVICSRRLEIMKLVQYKFLES